MRHGLLPQDRVVEEGPAAGGVAALSLGETLVKFLGTVLDSQKTHGFVS